MGQIRYVVKDTKETRTHMAVDRDTYMAIKAFAAVKRTTIVDALQYLIEQGFKAVYREEECEE